MAASYRGILFPDDSFTDTLTTHLSCETSSSWLCCSFSAVSSCCLRSASINIRSWRHRGCCSRCAPQGVSRVWTIDQLTSSFHFVSFSPDLCNATWKVVIVRLYSRMSNKQQKFPLFNYLFHLSSTHNKCINWAKTLKKTTAVAEESFCILKHSGHVSDQQNTKNGCLSVITQRIKWKKEAKVQLKLTPTTTTRRTNNVTPYFSGQFKMTASYRGKVFTEGSRRRRCHRHFNSTSHVIWALVFVALLFFFSCVVTSLHLLYGRFSTRCQQSQENSFTENLLI